jgi:hypothetical protein
MGAVEGEASLAVIKNGGAPAHRSVAAGAVAAAVWLGELSGVSVFVAAGAFPWR